MHKQSFIRVAFITSVFVFVVLIKWQQQLWATVIPGTRIWCIWLQFMLIPT